MFILVCLLVGFVGALLLVKLANALYGKPFCFPLARENRACFLLTYNPID